jgi:soluble lytic murein transglycosylase
MKILLLKMLLIFSFLPAITLAAETERLAQRQLYVRADHAFKKHDKLHYDRLKAQLTQYPLYPYLIFEELKYKIHHTKPLSVSLASLKDFETQYPDFPYHASLRQQWLTKTADAKKWKDFTEGYQPTKNEGLQCQYHYAKYQVSQDPKDLKKAKSLWLVPYSQVPACDPLFNTWKKQGGLTQDLINKRILLTLEKKNFEFAKKLSKQLPKTERTWVEDWEKFVKDPALLAKSQKTLKPEVFTVAMQTWARRDPDQAATWWKVHQADHTLTSKQVNLIKRDLAVCLAQQKSAAAEEWLRDLPEEAADDAAKEWRVRVSISKGEWEQVIQQIKALPASLKDDPSWEYWVARANEKLNNEADAKPIYQKLAKTRNYYGFLSSTRLNQPLSMQNEDLIVAPVHYDNVYALPAIKRFEELHAVGKESTARVEWFRAVDKMSLEERHAAAKIAQKMGLHDIAIFTMSKSTFRNDLSLRFPLAHEPEIINHAHQHNLDPAWVFAVARQESAFHTDAVSHAGARGLMQLLHSTAKQVAAQNHITYHAETDLHKPLTNIQLGTAYLKTLKDSMYNHIVLATASYNAGPGRIPRWLQDQPIETDIWIETIPYKETREYVKNVMAFTMVYRYRLGSPTAFALMLKPIPSKESA